MFNTTQCQFCGSDVIEGYLESEDGKVFAGTTCTHCNAGHTIADIAPLLLLACPICQRRTTRSNDGTYCLTCNPFWPSLLSMN